MLSPLRLALVFGLLPMGVAVLLSACASPYYPPAPADAEAGGPATDAAAATDEAATPQRGRVGIVEVYGPRRLSAGVAENFRVRLEPGSAWPVEYWWDFGNGIASVGNNITHRYDAPGRYTLTVVARNRFNADTARVVVVVDPPAMPRLRAADALPPPSAAGRAAAPFEAGDLVWVVGIHAERAAAEADSDRYARAGFRTAAVPARWHDEEAFFVAVGGFPNEGEAWAARPRLPDPGASPMWLLRLAPGETPR